MGNYDSIASPISGQPLSSFAFGQRVRDAIIDLDKRQTGTEIVVSGAAAALATTSNQPLVSTANADTLIQSLSYDFKKGYSYKISYSWRMQINGGTSPFVVYSKLRRLNAAGTLFFDPGGVCHIGTNFMQQTGFTIVKCSVADTTQTVALCGGFSTTGGPTSLDVESSPNAPKLIIIEKLGLDTDVPNAIEIPTS